MANTDYYIDKLSNLSDWKVKDEDKDIRGWDIYTHDGIKIGEVEDFIANTSLEKVVYLGVELDEDAHQFKSQTYTERFADKLDDFFGSDEYRKILIPVGVVRIDHENERVIASQRYNRTHFSSSPRVTSFDRNGVRPLNELIIVDYYTTDDHDYDQYRSNEVYDSYRSKETIDDHELYNNNLYTDSGYY